MNTKQRVINAPLMWTGATSAIYIGTIVAENPIAASATNLPINNWYFSCAVAMITDPTAKIAAADKMTTFLPQALEHGPAKAAKIHAPTRVMPTINSCQNELKVNCSLMNIIDPD